MAKVRIKIGYSRITIQDFRNITYFIVTALLLTSKEVMSQVVGFLMIVTYPILRYNDQLKKKQELNVEKDFPTFRKWNENIKKGLLRIKNKILDIKSRVQH